MAARQRREHTRRRDAVRDRSRTASGAARDSNADFAGAEPVGGVKLAPAAEKRRRRRRAACGRRGRRRRFSAISRASFSSSYSCSRKHSARRPVVVRIVVAVVVFCQPRADVFSATRPTPSSTASEVAMTRLGVVLLAVALLRPVVAELPQELDPFLEVLFEVKECRFPTSSR